MRAVLAVFDNFVNFSPPFNILSGRLKAVLALCHYQQQPVTYCNGSLQSREDVFGFIIAAESASNLRLERGSVRMEPQCALTRNNGASVSLRGGGTVYVCVRVCVCEREREREREINDF